MLISLYYKYYCYISIILQGSQFIFLAAVKANIGRLSD